MLTHPAIGADMVGADTGVPGIGGAENAHDARVIVRERTRAGLGNIEPRLPSPAKAPPSGPG